MAGMAAEGREIPITDRELTRGRRGTHSDRAHHHRRWFRAPARCRPEAGVPSRPRAFAQLGVRGFDRLPAVDAGRRPALQAVPAFCSVGGTRFRPPSGGRCRSETGAPPSARFCAVGGTRFRPPLGGRCRPEAGAPPSARFAQLGVRGFDRLPAVDAGRRPALRRPRAFAQLGVRGFDRLPAVDAGRRPALRRPGALLSWGYAVSTASRRSMPVGDRRSAVRAFCSVGGTRFRPPLGGRCRSETGAPSRPRVLLSWGTRFRPPLGGRCRSETGAPPSARFCSVGGTRFLPPPGGRCRSETGAPPSACLFALDDARSRCASRSEKSGLRSQSPETSPLRNSSSRVGSKKLSGISIPLSIPTGRCFTGVGGSGRISTISTFLRHSTTRSPRKAASTIWERCALASPRFTLIIVVLAQRCGTGGPKARSSSTTMTPFSST